MKCDAEKRHKVSNTPQGSRVTLHCRIDTLAAFAGNHDDSNTVMSPQPMK
jgi:hypothetical protein